MSRMKWLDSITQLCVGMWVGAMAGFAVTAPQIFAAFGADRQSAGDLAGKMINRLNGIGLVLGAMALVALVPQLHRGLNRVRTALLVVSLGLALFGTLYVFPQMSKAQPPRPIQEYAPTDPVRANYDRWHGRSRQVFSAAILLGAAVVVMGPLGKERD